MQMRIITSDESSLSRTGQLLRHPRSQRQVRGSWHRRWRSQSILHASRLRLSSSSAVTHTKGTWCAHAAPVAARRSSSKCAAGALRPSSVVWIVRRECGLCTGLAARALQRMLLLMLRLPWLMTVTRLLHELHQLIARSSCIAGATRTSSSAHAQTDALPSPTLMVGRLTTCEGQAALSRDGS